MDFHAIFLLSACILSIASAAASSERSNAVLAQAEVPLPVPPRTAVRSSPQFPVPAMPARSPDTRVVLSLFSELTGLTVLTGSYLPELPVALLSQMTNDTSRAGALLEAELAKSRMEMVRVGGVFALIAPAGFTNSAAGKWLAQLPAPNTGTEEQAPPGMIDFRSADLGQVLSLYAEFSNRTLLRSRSLPSPSITLKNQSPLTQAQMLYALDALLALNGIAVVRDGEKFAQVVMIPELPQIHPHAPKSEKSQRLMEPAKIPVFSNTSGVRVPVPRKKGLSATLEDYYVKARAKLGFPLPPPPKPVAGELAAYYAKLAGLALLPSKQFDQQWILFQVRNPLTKPELLYAIETTFERNDMALLPVDKKSIRIGHIREKVSTASRP